MIGIGDGGHGAVAVADIDRVGRGSKGYAAVVGDSHGLRSLGADHQSRVTVKDPCLIGTDS